MTIPLNKIPNCNDDSLFTDWIMIEDVRYRLDHLFIPCTVSLNNPYIPWSDRYFSMTVDHANSS